MAQCENQPLRSEIAVVSQYFTKQALAELRTVGIAERVADRDLGFSEPHAHDQVAQPLAGTVVYPIREGGLGCSADREVGLLGSYLSSWR